MRKNSTNLTKLTDETLDLALPLLRLYLFQLEISIMSHYAYM